MLLHEVNADTDIDQQTEAESWIHQWRSMTFNKAENGPSNDKKYTTSLLGH